MYVSEIVMDLHLQIPDDFLFKCTLNGDDTLETC